MDDVGLSALEPVLALVPLWTLAEFVGQNPLVEGHGHVFGLVDVVEVLVEVGEAGLTLLVEDEVLELDVGVDDVNVGLEDRVVERDLREVMRALALLLDVAHDRLVEGLDEGQVLELAEVSLLDLVVVVARLDGVLEDLEQDAADARDQRDVAVGEREQHEPGAGLVDVARGAGFGHEVEVLQRLQHAKLVALEAADERVPVRALPRHLLGAVAQDEVAELLGAAAVALATVLEVVRHQAVLGDPLHLRRVLEALQLHVFPVVVQEPVGPVLEDLLLGLHGEQVLLDVEPDARGVLIVVDQRDYLLEDGFEALLHVFEAG